MKKSGFKNKADFFFDLFGQKTLDVAINIHDLDAECNGNHENWRNSIVRLIVFELFKVKVIIIDSCYIIFLHQLYYQQTPRQSTHPRTWINFDFLLFSFHLWIARLKRTTERSYVGFFLSDSIVGALPV